MNHTSKTIVAITSLGLGLTLSSCIDPNAAAYYAAGGNYQGGSNYSAPQRNSQPAWANNSRPPNRNITVQTVSPRSNPNVLRSLPRGYKTEVLEGVRYFSHNGTFYRPSANGQGYVVVGTPRGSRYVNGGGGGGGGRNSGGGGGGRSSSGGGGGGDFLARLPSNNQQVIVRGIKYWVVNGSYYRPAAGGYKRVAAPR